MESGTDALPGFTPQILLALAAADADLFNRPQREWEVYVLDSRLKFIWKKTRNKALK